MYEFLMTLPLSILAVMFVIGSLSMMMSLDMVKRTKTPSRFAYVIVAAAWYAITLPFVISITGTEFSSLIGGFFASLTIGFFIMRAIQILMVVNGTLRLEDIYVKSEAEEPKP